MLLSLQVVDTSQHLVHPFGAISPMRQAIPMFLPPGVHERCAEWAVSRWRSSCRLHGRLNKICQLLLLRSVATLYP